MTTPTTTKTADQLQYEAAMDDQVASLLAQSTAALRKYERTIVDVDRQTIGDWYGMPDRMRAEGWMFYRCGQKKDASATALASIFAQHGWVPAPASTACRGFEALDAAGGGGIYICCPPDNYKRMKEIQRKARTLAGRKEIEDALTSELTNLGGVVDVLEVTPETMSGEDFLAKTGEQAEEAPRARQKRAS